MTCLGHQPGLLLFLLVELLRVTEVSIHTAHLQDLLLGLGPPEGEIEGRHRPNLEEAALVVRLQFPNLDQGFILDLLVGHHPLAQVEATLGHDATSLLGLGPIEPASPRIPLPLTGEEVDRLAGLLGDGAPDHQARRHTHGTHPATLDLLPDEPLGLVVEAVNELIHLLVAVDLRFGVDRVQRPVGRFSEPLTDADVGTPLGHRHPRGVLPDSLAIPDHQPTSDFADQILEELVLTVVFQHLAFTGVDGPPADGDEAPPPGLLDVDVELSRRPVGRRLVIVLDLSERLLGHQVTVNRDRVGAVGGSRIRLHLVDGVAQSGHVVPQLITQTLGHAHEPALRSQLETDQLLLDRLVPTQAIRPRLDLGVLVVQLTHAVVQDELEVPDTLHSGIQVLTRTGTVLLDPHPVDKGLGAVVANVDHILDVLVVDHVILLDDPHQALSPVARNDLRIVLVNHQAQEQHFHSQPIGKHISS